MAELDIVNKITVPCLINEINELKKVLNKATESITNSQSITKNLMVNYPKNFFLLL